MPLVASDGRPGKVIALGTLGTGVALLALGRVVGWDPTWRTFGVTPLQPPFFDMRVINDLRSLRLEGGRCVCAPCVQRSQLQYPTVLVAV